MSRFCVVCNTLLEGQKQKYCGNTCKQKDHYYRVKFQTNTYHSQTLRSMKRKMFLIELLGGGCQKCGYSANIAALHFHHIESSNKVFKLDARKLSNSNWDSILKEVEKCSLLCSNCHAEEHNPELSTHNVKRILKGVTSKKLEDEKGVNSGKP